MNNMLKNSLLYFLLFSLPIAFLVLLTFLSKIPKQHAKKKKKSVERKNEPLPKKKNNISVTEVFHVKDVTIVYEDKKYTVYEKGFVRNYTTLPFKYKKMLLQLKQIPQDHFKMDYDGKVFVITDAQGKAKKYKKYLDIPLHVRQKLPKVHKI